MNAQRTCSTDDLHQRLLRQDPNYIINRTKIQNQFTKFKSIHGNLRSSQIIIPVVIHVIYANDEQNLNDSTLQSQIEVLNNDFGQIQSSKYPQAGASKIKFSLAHTDPQGYYTSGILRVKTNQEKFITGSSIMYTEKGGDDAWPANQYLNIWVANITGILGYSYMPGSKNDGVVINYKYFGLNREAVFNLGRTTTHEVGHWLNLYHTWGQTIGCGDADDEVEDTPNSSGPNYNCRIDHESCGSIDMVENYMDYSNDGCMNLFTKGQVQRMEALFAPDGYRYSISLSEGWKEGIQDSLHQNMHADNHPLRSTTLCQSTGLYSMYDFIESLTINDSTSKTGDNAGSYTDTVIRFHFNTHQANSVSILPGQVLAKSKEYYSIWLDLNKDGYFTDSTELIYRKQSDTILHDQILIPAKETDSFWLTDTVAMRVQMQWNVFSASCDTFDFGEVENYLVILHSSNPFNKKEIQKSGKARKPTTNSAAYPNPTSTFVNIQNSQAPNQMIIYNCMGQVVMKIDKPEEDQRIDCAHLQEGIYYIQSFFEGHQVSNTTISVVR